MEPAEAIRAERMGTNSPNRKCGSIRNTGRECLFFFSSRRRHTRLTCDWISDVCSSDLVLAHHERWDGTGYPRGLSGARIPLSARIVMLADTFDAVTHNRRYRDGRGDDSAADIIASGRGTQFDPELVDLMLLPPVFDQIVNQERTFSRVLRTKGRDRRRGEHESAPDVTFRWRSELPTQTAQDL